jgi:hypothetical protein
VQLVEEYPVPSQIGRSHQMSEPALCSTRHRPARWRSDARGRRGPSVPLNPGGRLGISHLLAVCPGPEPVPVHSAVRRTPATQRVRRCPRCPAGMSKGCDGGWDSPQPACSVKQPPGAGRRGLAPAASRGTQDSARPAPRWGRGWGAVLRAPGGRWRGNLRARLQARRGG